MMFVSLLLAIPRYSKFQIENHRITNRAPRAKQEASAENYAKFSAANARAVASKFAASTARRHNFRRCGEKWRKSEPASVWERERERERRRERENERTGGGKCTLVKIREQGILIPAALFSLWPLSLSLTLERFLPPFNIVHAGILGVSLKHPAGFLSDAGTSAHASRSANEHKSYRTPAIEIVREGGGRTGIPFPSTLPCHPILSPRALDRGWSESFSGLGTIDRQFNVRDSKVTARASKRAWTKLRFALHLSRACTKY